MVATIFFTFKFLVLLNALGVILSKNPVHSVLFLVLVFINASFLLIFLEADFMALILIVVYVGAIAILFLFICMMLNVRVEQKNLNIYAYLPLSGLFVLLLIFEFSLIFYNYFTQDLYAYSPTIFYFFQNISNILVIGQLLYTTFGLHFIMCAFILLLAMVGAIFLTLHHRKDVRRQIIYKQLAKKNTLKRGK